MKVRYVIVVAALAAAAGAMAQAVKAGSKHEVNVPLSELNFEQPFGPQGPGFATIWGDRMKGEHGSFIKIAAGAPADLHTHAGDTWGVVVTGTMTHVTDGRPGKALTAGGWWFMPANVKHQSICAPGIDCLVFVRNAGPFSYVPVQAKK